MENRTKILIKISKGVYKLSEKRKGRSKIWTVFSEIKRADDTFIDNFVYCRLCNNLFKYNGQQTSNLLRHTCFINQNNTEKTNQPKKELLLDASSTPIAENGANKRHSADEESEECTVEPIAEVKISKPPEPKRSKSFSVHQISNSNLNSSQARPERSSLPVIDKGAKLDDPRVNAAYDILKATVAKNDDCSLYGEHVATKIRQYSDRTRSIVQHHINNILFEADIGKFEIQGDPLNSPAESNGSEKSVDFGYTTGFLHKNKTKKNKNKK